MTKNTLLGIVIGIIIGLVGGYVLATSNMMNGLAKAPAHDGASTTSNAPTHMKHPSIEVDVKKAPPSVSIEAIKDTKDGYNIHIITGNYSWAPEHVNQDPLQGEGHAHIYVNGVKLARVYGEWFHIGGDKLNPGKNIVEVTLNANDHSEWVRDGEHIADTTSINI